MGTDIGQLAGQPKVPNKKTGAKMLEWPLWVSKAMFLSIFFWAICLPPRLWVSDWLQKRPGWCMAVNHFLRRVVHPMASVKAAGLGMLCARPFLAERRLPGPSGDPLHASVLAFGETADEVQSGASLGGGWPAPRCPSRGPHFRGLTVLLLPPPPLSNDLSDAIFWMQCWSQKHGKIL